MPGNGRFANLEGGVPVSRALATVRGAAVAGTAVGLDPSGNFPVATVAPGALGASLLAAGAAAANLGVAGATTSLLGAGTHLLGLPNGNFEDGLGGWTVSNSGNSYPGVIDASAGNQVTGQNSVRLATSAAGDSTQIGTALIPFGAGIPLVMMARVKTAGGVGVLSIFVGWYDRTKTAISGGNGVGYSSVFYGVVGTAFAELGASVVPPPSAVYGSIAVALQAPAKSNADTMWVDEVRVSRAPLATDSMFYSNVSALYPARLVAAKLNDNKHILDFGAVGTGASNPLSTRFATLAAAQTVYPFATALTQEIDWAALQAAHNWLVANGGAKLNLGETQLYIGADSVTVTGMQYSQIIGAGIDKCKIIGTGASNDMLYYKTASTGAYYNHWEGFTVTSTATRTGGAHIRWMNEKHSMVTRVKTTRHFNGLQFDAFECMCLIDFYIVDPSGAGTGLVIGAQSTTPPTGSNFNMFTALIRGGSDQGAPPPVGNYGIIINDCDAVFAFNLDVGGVIKNDCLVQPSTRNYNNFWTSCYFDATGAGDCFFFGGAGVKAEHTFNGCWFASSGKAVAAGQTAPTSDTVGLRFLSIGSYSDIKCVGCVFYNNSGAGVLVETPQADINMTGCSFTSNGNNAVNWGHQLMIYPSSGQSAAMILNALKFNGTGANKWDILTGPYAYGNIASAMTFITGIQQSTYTLYAFKRVTASDDAATTAGIAAAYTVASATTITVQAYKDWIEITGSTTITGINATWPGHTISLHLQSTLTIRNQVQNIHLNGNDASLPAGTVITFRCNHNYQWYEISRTATAG